MFKIKMAITIFRRPCLLGLKSVTFVKNGKMMTVEGKTIRRPTFCAPNRTVPENVLIGVHIVSITLINIYIYIIVEIIKSNTCDLSIHGFNSY